MKVIMSVLSSRGENEGVCVSLCACGGSGGVPVPLLCPNEPKHSQNSCFSFPSSLLHVVQQGVSDFESLIQNFRKSSAPPSRELPHAPPPLSSSSPSQPRRDKLAGNEQIRSSY